MNEKSSIFTNNYIFRSTTSRMRKTKMRKTIQNEVKKFSSRLRSENDDDDVTWSQTDKVK
jgi:hypothetical protein